MFTPSNPSRRNLEISIIEDDRRTLSSQLKCRARQVFSSSTSNDLAYVARTSVEDVIPFETEEFGRLWDRTVYDDVGC